jgi:hypothetical protein
MGQEIVKNVKQIDFVFSGPSLVSFPEFVQYQINGEIEKCHSIQGVFLKRTALLAKPDVVAARLVKNSISTPCRAGL